MFENGSNANPRCKKFKLYTNDLTYFLGPEDNSSYRLRILKEVQPRCTMESYSNNGYNTVDFTSTHVKCPPRHQTPVDRLINIYTPIYKNSVFSHLSLFHLLLQHLNGWLGYHVQRGPLFTFITPLAIVIFFLLLLSQTNHIGIPYLRDSCWHRLWCSSNPNYCIKWNALFFHLEIVFVHRRVCVGLYVDYVFDILTNNTAA